MRFKPTRSTLKEVDQKCARPIPQADSPSSLSEVLDAVADGHFDKSSVEAVCSKLNNTRTVSYYLDALTNVGLLYQVAGVQPVEHDLTKKGADFVNGDLEDRTLILYDALAECADVQALQESDTMYLNERFDDKSEEEGGTRDRRTQALQSLVNHVEDFEDGGATLEKELSKAFSGKRNASRGTSSSASLTDVKSPGRGPKTKQLAETLCDQCYQKYNTALDGCPNCY